MQKRLMLMSLALVVLTSCGKLSSPVAPVPPSNVVAPSRAKDPSEAMGVDAANVIMTMVRAHLAGAAPDSGWVVLSTDTRQVDLLSFQNGLTPLADVAITAGGYGSPSPSRTNDCDVVGGDQTPPPPTPGP